MSEKGYEVEKLKLIYINRETLEIKEFETNFLKGMLSIVQSYALEFLEKGTISI